MKRKRVKIIYWAFLLSIIVHFTLAPIVRNMRVVEAQKEQTTQIVTTDHVRPTPPPPPKPTPKPLVQPKPVPNTTVHRPRPTTLSNHPDPGKKSPNDNPAVAVDTGGGDVNPGPNTVAGTPGPPAPSPSPTPTQTPKPTCSAPYVEATTREKFVPETPAVALQQGLAGVVKVKVDLSATGLVTDAKVFESSGSTVLDNAAVDAARRTTYSPKVIDCEHVPGSYLYRVTFDNN